MLEQFDQCFLNRIVGMQAPLPRIQRQRGGMVSDDAAKLLPIDSAHGESRFQTARERWVTGCRAILSVKLGAAVRLIARENRTLTRTG